MSTFRTGIFIGVTLILAGCAHSDLKAPCGPLPLPLAYGGAPEIPELFKKMDVQSHECGSARSVNDTPIQIPALIDGKIP